METYKFKKKNEWGDTVEREITIPSNADEWDLYLSVSGSGKAARTMTGALKRAIRAKKHADAVRIMREAMDKCGEWGAWDTEPRGQATSCLTKARSVDFWGRL